MGKSSLLATAGVVALTAAFAAAQEEDVVVVTATKREQTLQEVPVAVSVVQEDFLQQTQVEDITDLEDIVPSLRVSQLERSNNVTFIIRGFGNGGNNAGIEPSVAVYVDGVFRSRAGSSLGDFLNLERVEVLRGPQSTLFGKNATAGVVSFVTKKPSFEPEGVGEVTVGNFGSRIAKAYISGPITDNMAFSLAGNVNQREGYTDNLAGGADINDRDRFGLRGELLFEPTDRVEIRLQGDYDALDEICCTVFNAGETPLIGGTTITSGDVIRAIGGEKQEPGAFDYDVYYDTDSVNDIKNGGVAAITEVEVTPAVTLTSISAFRTSDQFISFEGDFTSAEILRDNTRDLSTETFTQELRFEGSHGIVDWLVGGFYFNEDLTEDTLITLGDDTRAFADVVAADTSVPGGPSFIDQVETAAGFDQGTLLAAGDGIRFRAEQDNTQYSFFAQADIAVTDRLTLTLGASYYNDEKEVSLQGVSDNPFGALDFTDPAIASDVTLRALVAGLQGLVDGNGNPRVASPAEVAAFQTANPLGFALVNSLVPASVGLAAVNPLLQLTTLQAGTIAPFVNLPNDIENNKTEDDDVPYTIRASYDLSNRTSVYASFATGFKASSWNLTPDSRPFSTDIAALDAAGLLPSTTRVARGQYAGTRFAGPEETKTFEAGLKTRWGWGSLNVAIFDQDVEGFQSQTFQGAGFVLTNAGSQSTFGVELESVIEPFEGLTINWAGTYLDAKFDQFENAPVPVTPETPDGVGDLSGERVPGVPEFSSYLGVRYGVPTGWGEVFARTGWRYESEVQVISNVPEDVASREVSVLDAGIGVIADNGFEALLWGKNLFEDEFYTSAFPTTFQPGAFSAYPNEPRTYGITLRKRF